MVVYAMQDIPLLHLYKQGFFSEFQAVLGALVYAQQNAAAGVRVQFSSDMYSAAKGDNFWASLFNPRMIVHPSLKDPEDTPKPVEHSAARCRTRLHPFPGHLAPPALLLSA